MKPRLYVFTMAALVILTMTACGGSSSNLPTQTPNLSYDEITTDNISQLIQLNQLLPVDPTRIIWENPTDVILCGDYLLKTVLPPQQSATPTLDNTLRYCETISNDGRYAVLTPNGAASDTVVMNRETGDRAPITGKIAGQDNTFLFAPDNSQVVHTCGDIYTTSLCFFNVSTKGDVNKIDVQPSERLWPYSFSSDGSRLIAMHHDMKTGFQPAIIQMQTKQVTLLSTNYTTVSTAVISPDGQMVAVAPHRAPFASITLFDTSTGKEIRTLSATPTGRTPGPGYGYTGGNIAFLPDSRIIAVLFTPEPAMALFTIVFWDVSTGEMLHQIEGVHNNGDHLHFSPDGKFFIAGRLVYVIPQ